MSDLFKNKYRIPSARLKNWNYAKKAMYFVTICTKNMESFFGEIVIGNSLEEQSIPRLKLVSGKLDTPCMAYLQPTEIGNVALSEWSKSVDLRPDMNITLGEFTAIPNHIHGIISIGKNEFNSVDREVMPLDSRGAILDSRDAMHGGSIFKNDHKNQFGPQSKNLSSIIRGYKSAVTTFARKQNQYFEWQERFHDHIIRSEGEYFKILNYIKNNPNTWLLDKFNPLNHKPSK